MVRPAMAAIHSGPREGERILTWQRRPALYEELSAADGPGAFGCFPGGDSRFFAGMLDGHPFYEGCPFGEEGQCGERPRPFARCFRLGPR